MRVPEISLGYGLLAQNKHDLCRYYKYTERHKQTQYLPAYTVSFMVVPSVRAWEFRVFIPSSVSVLEWLKAVFPVMFNQYWYFSSYAALFLFIPLLNIILEKMEKRQLQFCIGMILLFFSCIQTLFYSDAFGTNDGYSAIWLMILYLVGGYIRKYGQHQNRKAVRFLEGYFVMVGLTWLSKWMIETLTLYFLGEVRAGNYLISYKSPTILLAAVNLLLLFEKIELSSFWKKMIKVCSPMTFGVYLIHVHPLVFQFLFKNRFTEYAEFPWFLVILAVIGTAVCINILCYGIDYIRLEVFKKFHIRERLDLFEERLKRKEYR